MASLSAWCFICLLAVNVAFLSPSELAQYAANAGFSGQGLVNIVSKALAESRGNTDAVNYSSTEGRQGSWGVLQINADAHGLAVAQSALDPQTAFNLAYRISSNGTDFSPWHAQASPAQLAAAQAAATGVSTAQPTNPNGNIDPYGISSIGAAETGESPPGTTSLPPCPMWGLEWMSGNCTLGGGTSGATPVIAGSGTPTNQPQQPGTTGTPATDAGVAGVGSALSGLSTTISDLVKKLTDPATWQRTALIVLGITVLVAALFLFGFSMVERGTPAHA